MVELIAKLDPVMKEHLRRIQCELIQDHYLGKIVNTVCHMHAHECSKLAITTACIRN